MEKSLNIGIIQVVVNADMAWNNSAQMDLYEANAI